MKRKILILCLIFALVIPSVLVSCGKKDDNQPGKTTEATVEDTTVEETSYLETLSKDTLGYTEVRAMAFETNCIPHEIDPKASDVDKSLVKRDMAVEEFLDIDILYTPVTARTAVDTMRRSVNSGDNTFNVFFYQAQEIMSIAVEKCLQDLNQVPNLNLSMEWWNQSLCQNMLVHDKLFCAAGQYSQWYFGAPMCLIYNMDLATSHGISGIDELVDSGNWTIEELKKICLENNITGDTNPDGVMNEKDTYSIAAFSPTYYGLFVGLGGQFSVVNKEKDSFTVNIADDASIQKLESIVNVFNSATTYQSNLIKEVEAIFMENRALFFYTPLGFAADLVDVKFNYGIIPNPKNDTVQKNYISCANPQSNFCVGVPYGIPEDETAFVGLFLETYNYESNLIVKPAKYDSFMKLRVADNPESSERLDDMFANLYFDMNLVMNFGNTRALVVNTLTYASLDRYKAMVQGSLDQVEADINKLLGT